MSECQMMNLQSTPGKSRTGKSRVRAKDLGERVVVGHRDPQAARHRNTRGDNRRVDVAHPGGKVCRKMLRWENLSTWEPQRDALQGTRCARPPPSSAPSSEERADWEGGEGGGGRLTYRCSSRRSFPFVVATTPHHTTSQPEVLPSSTHQSLSSVRSPFTLRR